MDDLPKDQPVPAALRRAGILRIEDNRQGKRVRAGDLLVTFFRDDLLKKLRHSNGGRDDPKP